MADVISELIILANKLDSLKEFDVANEIESLANKIAQTDEDIDFGLPPDIHDLDTKINPRLSDEETKELDNPYAEFGFGTSDSPTEIIDSNKMMDHPLVEKLKPFVTKVHKAALREYQSLGNMRDIGLELKDKGWESSVELQTKLVPELSKEDIKSSKDEVQIVPTIGGHMEPITTKELHSIASMAADYNSSLELVGIINISSRDNKPLHPSQFYAIMKAALQKYIIDLWGLIDVAVIAYTISEWALMPVSIYADYYSEEFDMTFNPAQVETRYMPATARWLTGN